MKLNIFLTKNLLRFLSEWSIITATNDDLTFSFSYLSFLWKHPVWSGQPYRVFSVFGDQQEGRDVRESIFCDGITCFIQKYKVMIHLYIVKEHHLWYLMEEDELSIF